MAPSCEQTTPHPELPEVVVVTRRGAEDAKGNDENNEPRNEGDQHRSTHSVHVASPVSGYSRQFRSVDCQRDCQKPTRARKLKECEHRGDLVTHEIFERLNRTFITPIEREDIHTLASGLDDVLDSVEAIASRFVMFNISGSTQPARELARILVDCGVQIEQAVLHLKDFKNLMAFTIELNRLENEADQISRDAVADLFSGKHDVLDVMRWKEIYGRLENAADQCEDVANTIETIVIKNS